MHEDLFTVRLRHVEIWQAWKTRYVRFSLRSHPNGGTRKAGGLDTCFLSVLGIFYLPMPVFKK